MFFQQQLSPCLLFNSSCFLLACIFPAAVFSCLFIFHTSFHFLPAIFLQLFSLSSTFSAICFLHVCFLTAVFSQLLTISNVIPSLLNQHLLLTTAEFSQLCTTLTALNPPFSLSSLINFLFHSYN